MQLIVESEKDLEKAAQKIIDFAVDQNIWVFYGEMGAGKTTLIKAIARRLNVEDNVHSPTFSIVNEYACVTQKSNNFLCYLIYHFDFYRIKNEIEVMDIGVEEYFDSEHLCLIEWPQKIPSLLPERHLKIEISTITQTSRELKLTHHGR